VVAHQNYGLNEIAKGMFYHPDCDPQKMEIDWHALLMAG
jgi:hypothetical protein